MVPGACLFWAVRLRAVVRLPPDGGAARPAPLLDREPVAAQDGSGGGRSRG